MPQAHESSSAGGAAAGGGGAAKSSKSSRSAHKERRGGEPRRGEKSSEKTASQSKDKDLDRRSATSGAAAAGSDRATASAGGAATAATDRGSERDKDKERQRTTSSGGEAKAASSEKEKDKERPDKLKSSQVAQHSSQKIGGYSSGRHTGSANRGSEGLPEEVLTQIAQAKFEAQEDRLRDIARFSMALLRDFPKLSAADSTRRVAEVQKSLLKYEMQYIRAWEYQERRRKAEIVRLEAEAERCRKEAEDEGEKTLELREVLEQERRRRKRYEGYEEAAVEVNKKRTRAESQELITATKEDIERLKRQRVEHEALVEERDKRAQQLRSAASALAADLRRERGLVAEALGATGALAVDSAAQSAPQQCGAAAGRGGAASAAAAGGAELVEVIS